MRILALDLATRTGYAYTDYNGNFHCGTWLLATDKELKTARQHRMNRRRDPRVVSLFNKVHGLHGAQIFDVIVIEDVEFSSYTLQCQLWASLRAAVWLAPVLIQIGNPIFEAVPVGTLKKFATGSGWADKSDMVRVLVRSDDRFAPATRMDRFFYGSDLLDDNAADAIWLWKWAQKNLSRIK